MDRIQCCSELAGTRLALLELCSSPLSEHSIYPKLWLLKLLYDKLIRQINKLIYLKVFLKRIKALEALLLLTLERYESLVCDIYIWKKKI